jgi:hypothetical protein
MMIYTCRQWDRVTQKWYTTQHTEDTSFVAVVYWEIFGYPHYVPNLALSNFCLFFLLKPSGILSIPQELGS